MIRVNACYLRDERALSNMTVAKNLIDLEHFSCKPLVLKMQILYKFRKIRAD
jgi:hypothetical protein